MSPFPSQKNHLQLISCRNACCFSQCYSVYLPLQAVRTKTTAVLHAWKSDQQHCLGWSQFADASEAAVSSANRNTAAFGHSLNSTNQIGTYRQSTNSVKTLTIPWKKGNNGPWFWEQKLFNPPSSPRQRRGTGMRAVYKLWVGTRHLPLPFLCRCTASEGRNSRAILHGWQVGPPANYHAEHLE